MKVFIFNFLLLSFCLTAFSQEKGKASYYADKFEGTITASGQKYQQHLNTAAHKTLAFGTLVKVTNLNNNKTVIVVINDRGPHGHGRIIDLSKSAARQVGGIRQGVFDVEIKVLSGIESSIETPMLIQK